MNGLQEPDLATLVRVAEALQTTPDDLLGVGAEREADPRTSLLHRLNSATLVLGDEVLEIVVVQAEALAAGRRPPRTGL